MFFFHFSLTERLRSYAMVLYLSYMSLCVSLLCAFVGFLAGIELALDHAVREKCCLN